MTIDDGVVVACIVALSGGIVVLWRLSRKQAMDEIASLRKDLVDAISRIRDLENWKSEQLTKLSDRYETSASLMATAVKQLAANVNANTAAIQSMRCLAQPQLPEPHPFANADTEVLLRKCDTP